MEEAVNAKAERKLKEIEEFDKKADAPLPQLANRLVRKLPKPSLPTGYFASSPAPAASYQLFVYNYRIFFFLSQFTIY